MPVGAVGNNYNNVQTMNQTNANKEVGVMGKDDFMKLFLASLRYQDPMSPMETKDMMAQMSQLTMVESVSNLSKTVEEMQKLVNGNPLEKGVGFLGQHVEGFNAEGELVTGTVTEVRNNNGILELLVGEKTIRVGNISSVSANSSYEKYASF